MTEINMTEITQELFGCEDPMYLDLPHKTEHTNEILHYTPAYMRCRRCKSCLEFKKKQWTGRIVAESQLHKENAFVTLTYRDENYPGHDFKPAYKEVQKWLMTLRNRPTETLTYVDGKQWTRKLPPTFRYFAVGEHGPTHSRRLHWHLILFGMPSFPKGKTLSETWTNGFITWEPATVSRMKYVACYSTKKIGAPEHFARMSRRPGLGRRYFEKVGKQLYHLGKSPHDIKSIAVGKTHFPLDTTATQYVHAAYAAAAGKAGDVKSMANFATGRNQFKLRMKDKTALLKMLDANVLPSYTGSDPS